MSDAKPISTTKPPCSREDALAVLLRLRRAGHVAYFAGGCVRDLLLGLEPKDWDVATDAPPPRVRELFPSTQAVGMVFGVILVRLGRSTVEVATFRSEGTYSDGRRPDAVTFTNAREDAGRRDFTINGLFLDPEGKGSGFGVQGSVEDVQTPHGTVIDYVGGVADLHARVLRAIGDAERRFGEDHLRLLRAVRFAARFGMTVEAETADAIRRHAPRLKGISPERIADELRMMLTAWTRGAAWALLWEYGLLDVVFRFLPPAERRGFDAARSLFVKVDEGRAISFPLALAAGLLDYRMFGRGEVPSEAGLIALMTRGEIVQMGRALREALRISNEELDATVGILEPLAALLASGPPGVAAVKRFLARPTATDTRELMRALAETGLYAAEIKLLEERFDELAGVDVAPPPLITGDDLLAAGFVAGPAFKGILERVYDAQLEGRIATREEGMALARTIEVKTKDR